MVKCKNCDYSKKHKPLELVFAGAIGYAHYYNGKVHEKCYCGCKKPEPDEKPVLFIVKNKNRE